MRFLFIHQNFPGQYRHVTPVLAADPDHQVINHPQGSPGTYGTRIWNPEPSDAARLLHLGGCRGCNETLVPKIHTDTGATRNFAGLLVLS